MIRVLLNDECDLTPTIIFYLTVNNVNNVKSEWLFIHYFLKIQIANLPLQSDMKSLRHAFSNVYILYYTSIFTGTGTVRKEWGPKCTVLWKCDLFSRHTQGHYTQRSQTKDDQDGGGEPRSVTRYSHEGARMRWARMRARMRWTLLGWMACSHHTLCYVMLKQDMKLRRHKGHKDKLRHFRYAITLLVCYDTSGMLRHFWYATTLLTCYDTSDMLWHFWYATTLHGMLRHFMVCYDTSGMLWHFWYAMTLLTCFDTSGMLRHFWHATTLLTCYDTSDILMARIHT